MYLFGFTFASMKNVLVALVIAVLFSACGESNELKDPNVVAEKFLNEYIHMNYDAAKTYASEDFKQILDQYAEEKSLLTEDVIAEAKNATVEVKNMEIKETEGIAFAKFTNSQLPDIVDQLELRKVEEKWYANNVERTVDVELDNKFPDEEIEKLREEAEAQEETIPTEEIIE